MKQCSKPSCRAPGSAVLAYDYAGRRATLHDPSGIDPSPHVYPLCPACAGKLRPPRGWTLEDRRRTPPAFTPGPTVGSLG